MRFLLATVLFSVVFFSKAQEQEGFFQYHINVKALDTSLQSKQTAAMMRNSMLQFYYAPQKVRVLYKMGEAYSTTMVVDKEKDLALILTSGLMGNIAVQKKATEVDFNAVEVDSTLEVFETGESKKILGYDCQKIITESRGVTTVYWITNDFSVESNSQQVINPNLSGFPLEFSKVENGLELTFKASNISFKIENKELIFSVDPPEGYQQMPTTPSNQ